MHKFLQAAAEPVQVIEQKAYNGQPAHMRMYRSGYEHYFEALPALDDSDELLDLKLQVAGTVMHDLADKLQADPWLHQLQPPELEFNRTILAIEEPNWLPVANGVELIVARWGDSFTSPIHGHADGWHFEELLSGKLLINTYRVTDHERRIVRPIKSEIVSGRNNIVNHYTKASSHALSSIVHNFQSVGNSVSLHYLVEHSRDGMGNGFYAEYFENEYAINTDNLTQLSAQHGLEQLKIGDVALVRSENLPEYGDHFIVITGEPKLKLHGLRPQEVAIKAPYAYKVLDQYQPIMGLTLLKLPSGLADWFYQFHGITRDSSKIIFPRSIEC